MSIHEQMRQRVISSSSPNVLWPILAYTPEREVAFEKQKDRAGCMLITIILSEAKDCHISKFKTELSKYPDENYMDALNQMLFRKYIFLEREQIFRVHVLDSFSVCL